MRIVGADAQVAEGVFACETSSKEVKAWTPPPGEALKTLTCGAQLKAKYGSDGYSEPQHWCRDACESLPGCAPHPLPPPVIAPPPKPPPPPPPPPAELAGEGPCNEDADCSVHNGRTCCMCETIEVTSRLHRRSRAPECGCGDMSRMQGLPPRTDGVANDPGPCGPMPPGADQYRAVCRNASCVAVHR